MRGGESDVGADAVAVARRRAQHRGHPSGSASAPCRGSGRRRRPAVNGSSGGAEQQLRRAPRRGRRRGRRGGGAARHRRLIAPILARPTAASPPGGRARRPLRPPRNSARPRSGAQRTAARCDRATAAAGARAVTPIVTIQCHFACIRPWYRLDSRARSYLWQIFSPSTPRRPTAARPGSSQHARPPIRLRCSWERTRSCGTADGRLPVRPVPSWRGACSESGRAHLTRDEGDPMGSPFLCPNTTCETN